MLLEKPVSVDAKRSRQLMADLSDLDGKVRVAVCFQNRLNDTVVTLRRCLAEESAKVITVKVWSLGTVPRITMIGNHGVVLGKSWIGKSDQPGHSYLGFDALCDGQ